MTHTVPRDCEDRHRDQNHQQAQLLPQQTSSTTKFNIETLSLFTVLLSIYGVMSKQIFRKYIAVLPKNFTFFASIQIQQRLQLIL